MNEGFNFFDFRKYEDAIQRAAPDTWITLGDLEVPMVECSTCGTRMESKAAEFHKHPVLCLTCHDTYDANLERHDPNHGERQIGAGTIGHADGCTVVKL